MLNNEKKEGISWLCFTNNTVNLIEKIESYN